MQPEVLRGDITTNDITFTQRRRVIFPRGTIAESNEWYHHCTSVW
nr:hypothetical protein [Klebsiella electrica]